MAVNDILLNNILNLLWKLYFFFLLGRFSNEASKLLAVRWVRLSEQIIDGKSFQIILKLFHANLTKQLQLQTTILEAWSWERKAAFSLWFLMSASCYHQKNLSLTFDVLKETTPSCSTTHTYRYQKTCYLIFSFFSLFSMRLPFYCISCWLRNSLPFTMFFSLSHRWVVVISDRQVIFICDCCHYEMNKLKTAGGEVGLHVMYECLYGAKCRKGTIKGLQFS